MRTRYASSLLVTFVLAPIISAWQFQLKDKFVGEDFFSNFNFETEADPTHGRTNYVDMSTARASNLSFVRDDKFFMQPDSTNVVQPGARGRDSIRISSKAAYDESVVILDLQHMPWGCATWPAFWSFSATGPWPQGGEIDIIEGVNENNKNLASLHTTPQCSMPQYRPQTGNATSNNCDAAVDGNAGCGTTFREDTSYGEGFNKFDGGYYAMARTKADGISVWYWNRHDPRTPFDVRGHHDSAIVSPAFWGLPDAYFPTGPDNCDYTSHFNAHRIIFDLTFCGDWAGNVWASAGCGAGTCDDFVDNNPQAFENAYWEVNSLKIYTPISW